MSFEESNAKLCAMWTALKGGNAAAVATPEFKREWNRHADIVREREIVPKYPEPTNDQEVSR